MINFIRNFFVKKYPTGACIDTRPDVEKNKAWCHEEIVYGPQFAKWDHVKSEIKKYPREDQNATLSCLAHAATLAMGIDNELESNPFVRLSKAFFYRLRSNFPGEGMILNDVGKIGTDYGSCLFDTCPTTTYEADMNKKEITQVMKDEAQTYRANGYVQIVNYNQAEVLNSVASQGKGVVILIYATRREWAQEYPKLLDNVSLQNAPIRHGVCIVPNSGFTENGVRYVMVQDSVPEWGAFHCLSEEFIKARVYGALYFVNLENKAVDTKPSHKFKVGTMYLGDQNDEVAFLQKCLAYEGLFLGKATGYFGGLTLKAVKDFQRKYYSEILAPGGLTEPTGLVGSYTVKKLNQLFSN